MFCFYSFDEILINAVKYLYVPNHIPLSSYLIAVHFNAIHLQCGALLICTYHLLFLFLNLYFLVIVETAYFYHTLNAFHNICA